MPASKTGETSKTSKRSRLFKRPKNLMSWPFDKAYDRDGHGDCVACHGRCCTYVVVQIPTPRSKVDVDEIRWWLAHENLQVYIEDRQWHLQIYTPCRHLTPAGRCGIYDDRFDTCRQYSTESCEMSSGDPSETASFTTTEQFDKWWLARKAANKDKRERRKASQRAC